MLVEAERLTKFFGVRPVFRNLDFGVQAGEVVLVLGENGSGKSTLLRILAGLLRPSAGRLHVAAAPGEIGYVGHQPHVYSGLSAWQNLRFWCRLHGKPVDRGRMEEVLRRFGLERVQHEPVALFSRGMLQRLSLARIQCLSPVLYLLDEPSTGLDTASREVLHGLIRELRGGDRAVLWVSHDPDRDMALADKALRLSGPKGGTRQAFGAARPEAAVAGTQQG